VLSNEVGNFFNVNGGEISSAEKVVPTPEGGGFRAWNIVKRRILCGSGLGPFISQELTPCLGGEIGFKSQQYVGFGFAFCTRTSRAPPPNSNLLAVSPNKSVNAEGTT
jgi:hypothetical protein